MLLLLLLMMMMPAFDLLSRYALCVTVFNWLFQYKLTRSELAASHVVLANDHFCMPVHYFASPEGCLG
jgi:hypothetical protein